MVHFKRALLALTFVGACSAFADGNTGSQFYHQADDGQWELTPDLAMGGISMKNDTSKASFPFNTGAVTGSSDNFFMFNVKGEYGINHMMSVGVKLGFETDSWTINPTSLLDPNHGTSLKASGMTDPEIYLSARSDMGSGSLRYGANLRVSPGNQKIDSSGTSETEYSGGTTFTPYIGYEMPVSSGICGVKLKYDLIQTARKFTNNSTTTAGLQSFTITEGNNAALYAFHEMNFEQWIWGIDLGVALHSNSKINFSQPIFGTNDVDVHDNLFLPVFDTYATYKLSSNLELLPKAGMNVLNPNQPYLPVTVAVNKIMPWYVDVGLRYTF